MKKIVKSRWFGFLAGCILGMIIFMLIYGVKIINPAYEEWIYQKSGDINQHYIGWQFYRKSDWSFPIGLIEGLSEQKVSMMYTDSIPLFAVFFKILSPLLPETFQYMGLWGVFCFSLEVTFVLSFFSCGWMVASPRILPTKMSIFLRAIVIIDYVKLSLQSMPDSPLLHLSEGRTRKCFDRYLPTLPKQCSHECESSS